MKTNLLKAIALAIVMTPLYNCSVEPTDQLEQQLAVVPLSSVEQSQEVSACSGENPRARLINNGTLTFNFRIYSTTGSLLGSEANLEPGEISDWKTFPNGQSLFSITAVDFNGEKVSHLMDFCTEVSLEIDSNNQLKNVQPQAASN